MGNGTISFDSNQIRTLEFMGKREVVTVRDLISEFNYSYKGAAQKLWRLKKQGLVAGMGRGYWVMTIDGYRRLAWWKSKRAKRQYPMR